MEKAATDQSMTTRSHILGLHEVRAALADTLRLVVRPVAHKLAMCFNTPRGPEDVAAGYPMVEDAYGEHHKAVDLCPLGAPGDRLVCKETWKNKWGREFEYQERIVDILYRADGEYHTPDECPAQESWRSPATMPAWASRITLEVVGVRCVKAKELTNEDASKAGLSQHPSGCILPYSNPPQRVEITPLDWLKDAWESKYGTRYPWKASWVWAVEVRRER